MKNPVTLEAESNFKLVNLNGFLDLQFQQIAEQIPIVFALLVYQDCHQRSTATLYREFNSFEISEEDLNQFSSNLYLEESGTFLQVNLLGEFENNFLYFCLLSKKNFQDEYLLFLSETLLSPVEQQILASHAQIIQEYVNLYQAYNQQIDEIRTLEHLIHKISHELRNPLSLINLISENLRLSLPQENHQKQILSIQQTVADLNHSLTQLVDCGKRARLKLELSDLRQIILNTLKNINHLLESKQIKLEYPQDKEALITVDYLQIQQVFGNLLSNAIYFSPPGGGVTCNWRFFQQEIIITITDQGQGLSPQDLKNIFTPFYSRRPGGTGLGLTIVQKIIMDHGGRIWAENLPLGGSKFTFTLPR